MFIKNLTAANLVGANLTNAIGLQDPKDRRIAELEDQLETVKAERDAKPSIGQLQDARNGSIVIESENGAATITFSIEESVDLQNWQKTGEKITKTVQLKEGKKFYRFAQDK